MFSMTLSFVHAREVVARTRSCFVFVRCFVCFLGVGVDVIVASAPFWAACVGVCCVCALDRFCLIFRKFSWGGGVLQRMLLCFMRESSHKREPV